MWHSKSNKWNSRLNESVENSTEIFEAKQTSRPE